MRLNRQSRLRRAYGSFWTVRFGAPAAIFGGLLLAQSPSQPLGYTIATPRPISPAEGSTTPSAQATQRQNPFLGSVPGTPESGAITLTLQSAIERALRYNLGLIESTHATADVHAVRLRALAAMLPELTARGRQGYDAISFKEIGLKLPSIPGVKPFGATTGGFGYQDARVALDQSVFDWHLRREYDAQKKNEQASALSVKDSRDVVVLAVGTAYLQVVASAARVEMAKAQLASARELDRQTASRVRSEVSPEIDSLRAQVERQSAEQRLTNAGNLLEKDKLTLARIIGIPDGQDLRVESSMDCRPLAPVAKENAIAQAIQSRSDLASAGAAVEAAEATLRAERAQRLPVVSVSADYGGGGANLGNLSQVYSVAANVSVPLYTGGRIRADVGKAQSDLAQRQAEYADLKGRVAYDVRVALLDVSASESSVKVAQQNQALAAKALTQSQDRYTNGVTNYLEVVEAQEAVAGANENYIESLYSYNVSVVSLARAMGNADARLQQLLGGK